MEFITCKYNNICEILNVIPTEKEINFDDFYLTGKNFFLFFLLRLC